MKNTIKRDKLKEDENFIKSKVLFDCNYDYDKVKYFLSNPIPYLNGVLHLGHAYTISNAEFFSRYLLFLNYPILFFKFYLYR